MNNFSGLSYNEINDIASNLDTKASNMESILNEITTQLKKIGSDDNTWTGTAANAAFEEFNKLIVKFPEFKQAINDCASYLRKVVSTYKSVDSAVSGI